MTVSLEDDSTRDRDHMPEDLTQPETVIIRPEDLTQPETVIIRPEDLTQPEIVIVRPEDLTQPEILTTSSEGMAQTEIKWKQEKNNLSLGIRGAYVYVCVCGGGG